MTLQEKTKATLKPLPFLNEQEQKLLKSAAELKTSIIVHRVAVQNLADTILYERPDAFPNLEGKRGMVEEYLNLHDKTKLESQYFWSLVRYYGVDFSTLSTLELEVATKLIAEINIQDSLKAQAFFICNNLLDDDGDLNGTARELLKLERICDTVERGVSTTASHEFGRKLLPASQYLKSSSEAKLAEWLEIKIQEQKKFYHSPKNYQTCVVAFG